MVWITVWHALTGQVVHIHAPANEMWRERRRIEKNNIVVIFDGLVYITLDVNGRPMPVE